MAEIESVNLLTEKQLLEVFIPAYNSVAGDAREHLTMEDFGLMIKGRFLRIAVGVRKVAELVFDSAGHLLDENKRLREQVKALRRIVDDCVDKDPEDSESVKSTNSISSYRTSLGVDRLSSIEKHLVDDMYSRAVSKNHRPDFDFRNCQSVLVAIDRILRREHNRD